MARLLLVALQRRRADARPTHGGRARSFADRDRATAGRDALEGQCRARPARAGGRAAAHQRSAVLRPRPAGAVRRSRTCARDLDATRRSRGARGRRRGRRRRRLRSDRRPSNCCGPASMTGCSPSSRRPLDEARVVVLDIDRRSLAREGAVALAARADRAADRSRARAAGAAAIGVDILFATPDSQSPAALARKLADASGDARAPRARRRAGRRRRATCRSAGARRRRVGLRAGPGGRRRRADGAHARARTDRPQRRLERRRRRLSAGLAGARPPRSGSRFLPGDADGVVRRAPLFAAVGGVLKPGLALETLRLARGAPLICSWSASARA